MKMDFQQSDKIQSRSRFSFPFIVYLLKLYTQEEGRSELILKLKFNKKSKTVDRQTIKKERK